MAKNKLQGLMSSAAKLEQVPVDKPSKAQQMERMRYQAEDDLRTITRANEITRDRQRMALVKQVAKDQMKTLQCVTSKKPSGR